MPTTTTGTFFLGRQRAETSGNAQAGDFKLRLHVIDRQGAQAVESYRVTWYGTEAAAWWREHAEEVKPGTPLHLALHNPRSFIGSLGTPETHARVAQCSLAPLAPSWQKHAEQLAAAAAAPANDASQEPHTHAA